MRKQEGGKDPNYTFVLDYASIKNYDVEISVRIGVPIQ